MWWFWRRKKLEQTNIGNVLIQMGLITRDQLEAAVAIKQSGTTDFLGEILVSTGAVTRSQLERALFRQKKSRGVSVDFAKESQDNIRLLEVQTNDLAHPLKELRESVTEVFGKDSKN